MAFWEFELHGMTYETSGAWEMDTSPFFFFYDRSALVIDLRVVSLPKPFSSQLYLRQMGLLGSFTLKEGLCPL